VCKESDPSAEAQRQEQLVRRYVDARGLTICETYLDAGVSGGTLERPALQRLLGDCRAGKIGTVITQDPERLSRNPLSLIAVLESFLEDGVNVEFSTEEGKAHFEFLKVVRQAMDEIGVRRRFGWALVVFNKVSELS
jgi:site-specific DNA recombinase